MESFNSFLKNVIHDKTSKIIFNNIISATNRNYLNNLVEHLSKLLILADNLAKYHTLSKFVNDINVFLHAFYLFLKQRENFLIIGDLLSEKDFSGTLLKDFPSRSYFDLFHGNFKFYEYILKNKSTLTFSANLAELYESCTKILYLIFLLSSNPLIEEEINDVLFEIKFELYNHIMPTHLEDNGDEWGLLHQTKFLQMKGKS